jgi:hypothetical protein
MALLHTLTEKLAATMLARDGIEVIWRLHLAATAAHRNGYARSAASILEIADAAEEVCRARLQRLGNNLTLVSGGYGRQLPK